MAYKLQAGETPADVAHKLLGDARLTNELHIVNGVAYIRGEKMGPPTRYAGAPPHKAK
jgi:hypothetical protein